MMIDLYQVSAILFETILTGIISGLVVVVAYWLGKRQSDEDWKRKELHDKELALESQITELNIQIADLAATSASRGPAIPLKLKVGELKKELEEIRKQK